MDQYVKKELELQLMYLPFWLDEKDKSDWILWKKIYKCSNVLFLLFKDEVLDESEILFIVYDFDRMLNRIEETYFDKLREYYNRKLDDLMEIALDEEEYRTAHNIKEVRKHYHFFQKKSLI